MRDPTSAAIQYNHTANRHTLEGARTALERLLDGRRPGRLLDVGCGTGTWLAAALDIGIEQVLGIDGVALPSDQLHVPPGRILQRDLREDWGLDGQADLVLCLEVAEHLPADAAPGFVERLTRAGPRIFFSAASPWQGGQGHVHCRWPEYWQGLFNAHGFACRDSLRWRIWPEASIEPWYRQNLFLAERDSTAAGTEPRIPGVVHPECIRSACEYWRRRRQGLLVAAAEALDRGARRLLGVRPHE